MDIRHSNTRMYCLSYSMPYKDMAKEVKHVMRIGNHQNNGTIKLTMDQHSESECIAPQ